MPQQRRYPVLSAVALCLALSWGAASAQEPPRYRVGDQVQVQWSGGWYPATIIEVGSGARQGSYKIHYAGYGSNWDEYVPPARIAAARAEAAAAPAAQGVPEPAGRYVCQAFEAGQLHNQGEFVLSGDGSYRDVMYQSGGRWRLDDKSGQLTFAGGSLDNKARARLTVTAQGKTAVEFSWGGDIKRWCYRQSR